MGEPNSGQGRGGTHVDKVLAEMHRELNSLLLQKAAILRRIAKVKQIINGLVTLVGNQAVVDRLTDPAAARSHGRPRGFTEACRLVLMESERPLTSQEVCQEIARRHPTLLLHHKDSVASVSTVLNRLSKYGEAHVVFNERGRRAWNWTTGTPSLQLGVPVEPRNYGLASLDCVTATEPR